VVGTKGIYNIVAVGGEDSDAVWIVPIMIRDAIPVWENLVGGDKSPGAVRLAAVGKLTLLMDLKLVCEYRDVAMRPEHIAASGRTSEDAEAVIEMLEAIAAPVLVRIKHRPLSQDENDDMVLDVAINGEADAVVTNNIKDFRAAAERFGIQVLTPREFLIAFKKEETHHASESEEERNR
jgi:predicted nucleic acid-binding protein